MSPGPRLPGRLLVGALVLVQAGACTFERRADLEEDDSPAGSGIPGLEEGVGARTPEAVARLFREAVEVGDLSLALSLLDRSATLVDALAGAPDVTTTRGELLLELRRRHGEGLALEELEARSEPVGESTLVLTRLALMELDEDGIGIEVGRVYETALLTPVEGGWRIRHLHRSLTLNEAPGDPRGAPPGG